MTGLNAYHETGDQVRRPIDERVAERRIGGTGLYVVIDVVLLCFLGALVYGLVRIL